MEGEVKPAVTIAVVVPDPNHPAPINYTAPPPGYDLN